MDNTNFISSLLLLIAMIGALAALPWLLKRWQQRQQQQQAVHGVSTQILSSVVVGQQQRVVTIEVGQGEQKTCLVLGITPQNIQCLHVLSQPGTSAFAAKQSVGFASAMAQAQTQSATEAPMSNP